MQILVVAVGKLKESYWRQALAEYSKRLSAYAQMSVIEVSDEAVPENAAHAEIAKAVQAEGEKIGKHLRDRDGVIALDIQGKALSSEQWSRKYEELAASGFGRLVFVIGGSHGLSERLLSKADFRWSLGPITLPHQLARIVLVEQIYRGIRISRNEPYHK